MAPEGHSDRTTYRLIITRRNASEILLSTELSGRSLPRIEAPSGVRLAEQLVTSVRKDYGLETYCLSSKTLPPSPEFPSPVRYALLEALAQDNEASPATTWISSAIAASETPLARADRAAILSSLEDLNRSIREPMGGPFARPGWINELFDWVQSQIEPLGLRLTGRFRQLNASPTFSLVRIETAGPAVWFKATGEPNRHELPITVALHRLFPTSVPRILGIHPSWNGWLSEEAPGRTLDPTDVRASIHAARALAEVEIASVAQTQSLLEAGCKDLRLPQLTSQIEPFLDRVSELMALQTSEPPQTLADPELGFLHDCLKGALSEFEQDPIPSTLGHLDPNPGNILVSSTGCRFLDWAEACVTHPFFTFEYLREHARRSLPEPDTTNDDLVAAYLGPWQSLFSPETLAQAMAYSPLLAVYTYAVAGKKWSSPETLRNPALGGYFRSLARRAYREATKITARSGRCLA
jgi:hypothetical protein